MQIVDIPEYKDKNNLLVLDEDTSVFDAASKMRDLKYGAVLIIKNNKAHGIFTERDLLNKIAAEHKEIKGLKLKDVMTTNLKTAKETDEVLASMRRMSQGRFRHLPIVDENDEVIGMISQGDFVAITWPQLVKNLKTQAKASFYSYTQLWMMVIVILAYFTFIKFFT